eukprot:TRINITY_DN1716_c0_g1_i1.p1 TRINITY_DN1716_c0_g1~~TRINITY_DN1716_c0_g1_i1.p1  ORF type:complete len:445 (-),score=99.12 TRINITY_DN1716_c0_g1_i1:112-1416(-)
MVVAKAYRQILNPGEMNHRHNPLSASEDVLIVERGNLNAKCRRSDIFRFLALISFLCAMFLCLSIYWMSVKNLTEQSKEELEEILAKKESSFSPASSWTRTKEQDEMCSAIKVVGECKGAISRWFYDSERDTCSPFIYSGCNGTANNFESLEDCASSCIASQLSEKTDPCTLGPDPGPCRGSLIRYAFHTESRLCQEFVYGGCGGNENNFGSIMDCQSQCDKATLSSSPLKEDPCSLPSLRGPCRGNIPRWYFDSSDTTCKKFVFGGCLPNKNNFLNQADCEAKCAIPSETTEDVCSLPIDTGSCKSILPRFAFDVRSKTCVAFSYSGCEGNRNRFSTQDECARYCQESLMDTLGDDLDDDGETLEGGESEETLSKKDVCSMKPDSGSCKGTFIRYFFNGSGCESFNYGGCLGNDNNFESVEKCEATCSVKKNA